ncbi:hypothetical protein [Rhizobium ruizarguesonis]|uniref:hypothetical protein n=1 Tax=Rhizobium ruizarguesonis TaxID=2081791 RepID=UPI001FD5512B|nr:hypothetical protein [Rhizobium ruizarguesonis]
MVGILAYKPSKLYKAHVANLRELDIAISVVRRQARAAIARKDPEKSLDAQVRLLAFLTGAWAETRLNKLLHEEFGFSAAERDKILEEDTQIERWKKAVDVAFRKNIGKPKAKLGRATLGVAGSARRDVIHEIIESDLRIIIEIRNKLAHGQWHFPLSNDGTKIESKKYTLINKENLMSLQFKQDMMKHLSSLIHDLIVSPAAFERDFESHYVKLENAKRSLLNESYSRYEATLQRSREKFRSKLNTTP